MYDETLVVYINFAMIYDNAQSKQKLDILEHKSLYISKKN